LTQIGAIKINVNAPGLVKPLNIADYAPNLGLGDRNNANLLGLELSCMYLQRNSYNWSAFFGPVTHAIYKLR
jgi:hypothetical protein